MFCVCFWVLGFNKNPLPPVTRLWAAHSLQPKLSHFTSLHFNQSFICAPNHLSTAFLKQCSMWFSVLTKDGVRMMAMYLPVAWTVVLCFTTNWHHHHHHHHHILLTTFSLSLMSCREKKFSRQFLCGIISGAQAILMPPHRCLLLRKHPVSWEPNSPSACL